MQPILIRGLKRSFTIDAAWADTPLAYVSATPQLFEPATNPEPIEIVRTGALHTLTLPSGRVVGGSLNWLALQLDEFVLRDAIARESEALLLPAALLRNPYGSRIAFVGGRNSGKTWLALALLAAGWCFEGDAWVVARRGGTVALPRTLRLRVPLRALPPAWRDQINRAPCLRTETIEEMRAVDPRIFSNDWSLRSGPLAAILFLEFDPGGRGGLYRLDADRAFQRALALCHGRMTGASAAALRVAIAGARNFRFRFGRIDEAAESATKVLDGFGLNGISH